MEIVLTGTGSPIPDAHRAGPSTLVKSGSTSILVDAGRGTVMRLAATGVLPGFLSAVCITHLHSDHVCALNDVITTHWVFTQGNTPLRLFGPPGLADFVDRTLEALAPDISYRMDHHAVLNAPPQVVVTELQPGDTFVAGDVQARVEATEHAPVKPTLGFRFEHEGVTAALAGDTIPCSGLDSLCAGADAYVQTVIRRDLVEAIPHPMFQDILDYHSGVVEAATTAERAGVRYLLLTHLVPAPPIGDYAEWRAIAAEHFSGEIVIGDDLTSLEVLPA